jgi:hypothetical protein
MEGMVAVERARVEMVRVKKGVAKVVEGMMVEVKAMGRAAATVDVCRDS